MAPRDYIQEILSKRRNGFIGEEGGFAIFEVGKLKLLFNDKSKSIPLHYFPIRLVACMEAFFRSSVKDLIDFGSPYSDNASRFKDIRIDFKLILAIQGKLITIGDFISHLLPFNNLSDINTNMSILTGMDFLKELRLASNLRLGGKMDTSFASGPSDIYRYIEETFRLRHIYCHELAIFEKPDPEVIDKSLSSTTVFLSSVLELIVSLTKSNFFLNQSEMNEASYKNYKEAETELDETYSRLISFFESDELQKLKESQKAWEKFRDAYVNFVAGQYEGGSIQPMIRNIEMQSLTKDRIKQLMELLEEIEKI